MRHPGRPVRAPSVSRRVVPSNTAEGEGHLGLEGGGAAAGGIQVAHRRVISICDLTFCQVRLADKRKSTWDRKAAAPPRAASTSPIGGKPAGATLGPPTADATCRSQAS